MSEGYIFSELDIFINQSLDAVPKNAANANKKNIAIVKQDFDAIHAKCRQLFLDRIFSIKKEKEMTIFINNIQTTITNLADKIVVNRNKVNTKEAIQWHEHMLDSIDKLLMYAEQNFSSYINYQQVLPFYRLQEFELFLETRREAILSFFQQLEANESLLLNIVESINIVQQSIALKNIRFQQYHYWYNLYKEITTQHSFANHTDNFLNPATSFLVYVDYNSASVFRHILNELRDIIYAQTDGKERVDKILFYIKRLQQTTVIPGMILYPKMPSLKNQLITWLHEELHYFERKQQLQAEALLVEKAGPNNRNAKLHTSLSVDQLSIIFRAAADTGVIEKKSYKSLFEQMAPLVSTPYTKHISAGSLRTKAYTAENRDKQVVKDVLMELYKKVNQY